MLPWFWVCCATKPLDKTEEDDTDDFLFRGDRPDSQIRSSTPICKHHRVLQDTDERISFGQEPQDSGIAPGEMPPQKTTGLAESAGIPLALKPFTAVASSG
mmetsp:Transcript_51025/g.122107  ORF Transcript_51025/g.122107 Transcript_51025/m.122107 type:complete len:101 (-) Transcript_51025:169-471(-)